MPPIVPGRCILCNGTITEVALKTHTSPTSDFWLAKIGKWFTRGSQIQVYVCSSCGHVSFYAQNLERLL